MKKKKRKRKKKKKEKKEKKREKERKRKVKEKERKRKEKERDKERDRRRETERGRKREREHERESGSREGGRPFGSRVLRSLCFSTSNVVRCSLQLMCQSDGTAMCALGTSVAGACSSTARLLQSGSQAAKCLSSSSCGTFAVLSRDWL